jgi:hypothetical protein
MLLTQKVGWKGATIRDPAQTSPKKDFPASDKILHVHGDFFAICRSA